MIYLPFHLHDRDSKLLKATDSHKLPTTKELREELTAIGVTAAIVGQLKLIADEQFNE